MTQPAPSITAPNHLTTQEKLLLSQAVYKLGAVAWPVVSGLLLEHPCCAGRNAAYFSPEGCEENYVTLMTSIGINVYVLHLVLVSEPY